MSYRYHPTPLALLDALDIDTDDLQENREFLWDVPVEKYINELYCEIKDEAYDI